MKEDFLIVDHNTQLRKLYLKCITLYRIQIYLINKNQIEKRINKNRLNKMLIENRAINEKLDNSSNTEIIKKTKDNINTIKETIINTNENINNKENTLKANLENVIIIHNETYEEDTDPIEEIFSPRKNVTINMEPINLDLNDVIIETIETDEDAKETCVKGCGLCHEGCDLFFTGIYFTCSFINYYVHKLVNNIKKCFTEDTNIKNK